MLIVSIFLFIRTDGVQEVEGRGATCPHDRVRPGRDSFLAALVVVRLVLVLVQWQKDAIEILVKMMREKEENELMLEISARAFHNCVEVFPIKMSMVTRHRPSHHHHPNKRPHQNCRLTTLL